MSTPKPDSVLEEDREALLAELRPEKFTDKTVVSITKIRGILKQVRKRDYASIQDELDYIQGLGVSAIAYLLQVWAQTRVTPSRTAMVLGLEPVFGVLTAAAVLGERLTVRGWLGAAVILGAVYLVIAREPEPDALAAEAVSEAH